MLQSILEGAWRLDRWLKQHLGRPYTLILGASLVLGISAELRNLSQALGSTSDVARGALTVLIQFALLVNQLAQLHAYRHARRRFRAARRKPTAAD